AMWPQRGTARRGAARGAGGRDEGLAPPAALVKSSTGEKMSAARLQERYRTTVHPALIEEFGYKNPMQVPRLEKIVVNIGVGEAVQDSQKADAAASDLTSITAQHPAITKANPTTPTLTPP